MTARHSYCNRACRNFRDDQLGIERVLHFPTRDGINGLERAGSAILDGLGVQHVNQHIVNGKFVVDVLIPDANLIIQWDGDFWHGNPALYPNPCFPIQTTNIKRDRACTAYLTTCGYRVLRFWESDVHGRASWVAEEIVRALANSSNT